MQPEPEPEPKLRNFFGSSSSSGQKGRLRLRLRLQNIDKNVKTKKFTKFYFIIYINTYILHIITFTILDIRDHYTGGGKRLHIITLTISDIIAGILNRGRKGCIYTENGFQGVLDPHNKLFSI